MSARAISDSTLTVLAEPLACANCGSASRIKRGLCLNCMLQIGTAEPETSATDFHTALDAIDVRDSDWRLGNYQILEEVGRGGMGVIYRARQRHSRRIVALKRVLSYHADSRETLARFRREAEAAASLDHPNILPIYEVSESDDGLPYFSMKFAPGGSLLDVAPGLRADPRRCVALMAKVARAVQFAHLQGILHRDLKPGNIMLDARGEPLVSDFGLAKWLDTRSDLTRTLTVFGTPGYIAPEQAQGDAHSLTPAADVYSLGAILFDLFTGRPPFLGEHALAVIKQAADKPAPKLRSLAPTLDRDLETICAKCLERDPKARYRSAGALADDLERWLEGRPIVARPVSPPVRVWRWSKRNPKLAGSLAAAVVLGLLGLGGFVASSRLSAVVRQNELASRSVVVVPFEDLDDVSSGSNSAEMATRALRSALGEIKRMRVSRGSREHDEVDLWRAEDWQNIGQRADARFALRGSVRERNGKHHLAAHLIETRTGGVVKTWVQDAESYADIGSTAAALTCELFALPKITTTASAQPVFSTNATVNSTGYTSNALAQSYYERGKEFLFRYNLADQGRAIDSFEEALKLDPNYGQAHAMLAMACQLRAITDPSSGWLERADGAVTAALKIAPLLPESHLAKGDNLGQHAQLRASIDEYLIAYELDPANGRAAAKLGYAYDRLGRPDMALRWFQKAANRETRPVYADNIASAWTDLGYYDDAENAFRTAAIFRPDLPVGALGLSTIAIYRGDFEQARSECRRARAMYPDNPQPLFMAAAIEFFARQFDAAAKLYGEAIAIDRHGGVEFIGAIRFLSALGYIERQSQTTSHDSDALLEEARQTDERELSAAPDDPSRLYSLAATEAAAGRKDLAVTLLARATASGWIDHRAMELDPRFDSIRNTQTFTEILTRLTNRLGEMRRHQSGRKLTANLTN